MERPRVLVALSGGVDSSVAAALLMRQGYEVIGLTLCLGSHHDASPDGAPVVAGTVAAALGIPIHIVDAAERFREEVLRPSWEAYARGLTPNPCAMCNPLVKFTLLHEVARAEGAPWIATGHYARIARDNDGTVRLMRARDNAKDQSYFLFGLTSEHLSRAIFPVGDLLKSQVRRLAYELGLPSALRADSQDACVAGSGTTFPEFLRALFGADPIGGPILLRNGTRVGSHGGFHRFTIGQRRGLGIAMGTPAWVSAIDPESASVILSTSRDDLLAYGLHADRMNWHTATQPGVAFRCLVQIRSGQRPVPATVVPGQGGSAAVRFDAPVWAVTPGQAVVCYEGEVVRGGGRIREALTIGSG